MTPIGLRAGVFSLLAVAAASLSAAFAQESPPAKSAQPAAKAAPSPARLTPKQLAFVKNELLPAWRAGDPLHLLRLVGEQVARQSEQQNAALDRALAEEKAPSLGRMLTDARMNLVRLDAGSQAPEATLAEIVLMVGELERQIQEKIATAKKVELFADPLPSPATLTEFRDQLWKAHVQNNELINAAFLALQGRALLNSPLIAKVKNPTPGQEAAFAIDFVKYQGEAQELQRDLNERAIELRVNRIAFALKLLEGKNDLKERFLAAYAVGVDGEILIQGLKNDKVRFRRENLSSPTLADELRASVDRGKTLAGDLIKKSELLFAGLHWWRRGRYGRGSELHGLLKPEAALKNPAAQIGLLMPRTSPEPTDPAKGGRPSPDFDRRHHWTWAWEDRQFETVGTGSHTSEPVTKLVSTETQRMRHWDGIVDDRFY